MTPTGLIVHDDQAFLSKVVGLGMEQGIFTSDRADEIVRISIAMANKYVLHKEVDFRSAEELASVQETILKLIGIGLEIRSEGRVEKGVRLLMEASPVELFRIAHTRIDALRQDWSRLLEDHGVKIYVSPEEYENLDDLSVQRLAEMSIFSETELDTIRSLKLGDEMFASLDILEYYESELDRYRFILKLKEILPFDLLNRSSRVRAQNVAEVDTLREALVTTIVISAFVNAPDPVTVSMEDIAAFLATLDPEDAAESIPPGIEEVLIEVIHELGEDLDTHEAQLLTREIIRIAQVLLETVSVEWDRVTSPVEMTFYERWKRMAILSDQPDALSRVFAETGMIDEFDFEMIVEQLCHRSEEQAKEIIEKLDWNRLTTDRTIRLFQEFPHYQGAFASQTHLTGFSGPELVDLLDLLNDDVFAEMLPTLEEAFLRAEFSLEDLQLIARLDRKETWHLMRFAGPPVDSDSKEIIDEFREVDEVMRRVYLLTAWNEPWFPELFHRAWDSKPDAVKRALKTMSPVEAARFLDAAAGNSKPLVEKGSNGEPVVEFSDPDLNAAYKSLPKTKKKAVVQHFSKGEGRS